MTITSPRYLLLCFFLCLFASFGSATQDEEEEVMIPSSQWSPTLVVLLQLAMFALFYHQCFEFIGSNSNLMSEFGSLLNMSAMTGLFNNATITYYTLTKADFWMFVTTFVLSTPSIIIPHLIISFCHWGPYYVNKHKNDRKRRWIYRLANLAPSAGKRGVKFLKVLLLFFVPFFMYAIGVAAAIYYRYRNVGADEFFTTLPSEGEQRAMVIVMCTFFLVLTMISLVMHIFAVMHHTSNVKARVFSTVFAFQGTIIHIAFILCLCIFLGFYVNRSASDLSMVVMVTGTLPLFIYVIPESFKYLFHKAAKGGYSLKKCCGRGRTPTSYSAVEGNIEVDLEYGDQDEEYYLMDEPPQPPKTNKSEDLAKLTSMNVIALLEKHYHTLTEKGDQHSKLLVERVNYILEALTQAMEALKNPDSGEQAIQLNNLIGYLGKHQEKYFGTLLTERERSSSVPENLVILLTMLQKVAATLIVAAS